MPNQTPHVLIFPLPLQGPVNCMLKLAEILSLHGLRVTFLNTHHIQQRLFNCTDIESYFDRYPSFQFATVPDGLPEENPRTADQVVKLLESMEVSALPVLQEMVGYGGVCGPNSGNPVTCLIADGVFGFAVDVARVIGAPLLYFDTISPCGLWSCLCVQKLIEAGEIPFADDNLDEMIRSAPGMEGIMRRRDLPSFFRTNDVVNDRTIQLLIEQEKYIPLGQGLIFNTFQQLEGPVLSQLRKISPRIYTIGPLHEQLKTRLAAETGPDSLPANSGSIWKEDRSCISWLDLHPSKSVVFVSIGSLALMTKDQLFEIWHGLVNSGSRFLWVRRPGSVVGLESEPDQIPSELLPGTKERGCIVKWAPQEEVLAHRAIGGFLTHSGWNSTLESMVEGIPMICWPSHADQQVNSRYVEVVWKLGLDMKDKCDRFIVEKMVREVMELRKDEFLQRAEEMAELAKSSVRRGGLPSLIWTV